MPNGSNKSEISDALASIQKQLSSIQKSMKRFENRMTSLEQTMEQKTQLKGDNPLIYSRALMLTLDTIRDYETENGHGVVAKTLARVRGLEPPTVYDHLSKLEEADLIFWQRGTELGLKPFNAKFYSVANREESLEDIPVLMRLADTVIPIAQSILTSSSKGISRTDLLNMVVSLKESGEKPWKTIATKEIASTLDDALQTLLRRVLIDHRKTVDHDFFYPRNK